MSAYALRISDLIERQGDVRAQRAMQQGQRWGGIAQAVGQIPMQIGQLRAQQAQGQQDAKDRDLRRLAAESQLATEAKQRENLASQIGDRDATRDRDDEARTLAAKTLKVNEWLTTMAATPDQEAQRATYTDGRAQLIADGTLAAGDAPESFPGASWVKARLAVTLPAAERFKQLYPEAEKPQPPMNIGPRGVLDPNTMKVVPGTEPPPETPKTHMVTVPGPNGPIQRLATEAELAQGVRAYRAPVQGPQESMITVVSPEGEQRRVTNQEANALFTQGWKTYDQVGARQGAGAALPAEMPAGLRNAARMATLSVQVSDRTNVTRTITDLWADGDEEAVKQTIKRAALDGERSVDVQRQVLAREVMLSGLKDTKAMMAELKAAGIQTNVLTGTLESVARKLGATLHPKRVEFQARVGALIMQYRQAMTGLAFGTGEGAEYAKITPVDRNLESVNVALIDGLERAISASDRVYWESKLGKDGAAAVFTTPTPSGSTAAASRARVLPPGQGPASAPSASSGRIRARDPQGNIHEADAGTALPAGWVVVR